MPATRPSLGTLIRVGNEFLYSGEWWITVFPGAALVILVLSVNLLGDWLRDALNPQASMILEVEHLKVQFPTRRGTLTAVDDVSFSIAPGEVLGVVGESGAGKSITGMAVIGLLDPPGRIAGGRSAPRGPAHRQPAARRAAPHPRTPDRRHLPGPAHLAQPALHHRPAARGNHPHASGRSTDAQARERALSLLREVGIPAPEARYGSYPHHFSGGMRQRVVIALALAAEPRLLIADEPTTALDVSIQAQIIALLKRLAAERGAAVMLITHDMGVIAETAQRVAVMYAGRIAEIGPVRDVIHAPRHPYTVGPDGFDSRSSGRSRTS